MSAVAETPLKGTALAVTAFALAMGTFMQVLDTTIANVSLPTIAGTGRFHRPVHLDHHLSWSPTVSAPITGWLMKRYGVVKVFVLSVLGFTSASLLCGMAWSLESLVLPHLAGAVSGPIIRDRRP